MASYPDRHHPCYFLEDALTALGVEAQVVRDERTLGCWGLIVNGKTMVWLIDNRHPHEAEHEDPAAKELIARGDLVCCAQKPDAERVGGKWLPLAATPGYRPPDKPAEKLYDVCFVGYVRDNGREKLLRHVARHFNLCVQEGVFGNAAVSAYWQSKVGLNVPTGYGQPDAYDTWNMRAPEIMATGTALATSYEPYLAELGITESITYGTPDGLIKELYIRLNNPKQLAVEGANNIQLVQKEHTYAHRAKQVLQWLE